MEIFLDRYIIVINCSWGDGTQMIAVCEAVMTQIMTGRCYNHTKIIDLFQLQRARQITLCHHQIAHLHDIGSVQIIMVRYFRAISFLDSFEKIAQLC